MVTMVLWWPWCCCGGHGPGVAVVAMVLVAVVPWHVGVAVVTMVLPGVAVVTMVLLVVW